VLELLVLDALTEDQFFDDFFDSLDDDNELVEIVDIESDIVEEKSFKYVKKPFMTWNEKLFYNKLKKVIGNKYIIQPQINLATIIDKKGLHDGFGDLFRNIDFGIFSKEDYQLLLLIELNDSSHLKLDRQVRDIEVDRICRKAGYNLIKFWTNQPNKLYYIDNRIHKNIVG
jgi:hypothetical protein